MLSFLNIDGFTFVWFTDGKGWTNARHNLEETFDVMEHIYNIKDMENGIIDKIICFFDIDFSLCWFIVKRSFFSTYFKSILININANNISV